MRFTFRVLCNSVRVSYLEWGEGGLTSVEGESGPSVPKRFVVGKI